MRLALHGAPATLNGRQSKSASGYWREMTFTRSSTRSPGDAEIVKGLTAEHIAAMIIKEARAANHAGARVRALELLGKWSGAFVERYEDVTKRPADQRLRTPAKTRPAPANQLAPLPGVGLDL